MVVLAVAAFAYLAFSGPALAAAVCWAANTSALVSGSKWVQWLRAAVGGSGGGGGGGGGGAVSGGGGAVAASLIAGAEIKPAGASGL